MVEEGVIPILISLLAFGSPSDELKRSMAPSMVTLVMMLESSRLECAPELASYMLVSLLVDRSNRKELACNEKSMARLVQMLDPG